MRIYQMRTSLFYPLYLFTLHETAKKPTIELIRLLVEYNKSTARPTNMKAALEEPRVIIMLKWYLACPYRFHDIVDILHDKTSSEEIKGVCTSLLDAFIRHLSTPSTSTESTVLHHPEIIDHIRRIKEGSKPAAITDSDIRDLVKNYGTHDALVPDATYGPLCLWKAGQVTNMTLIFSTLQWKDEWDVRLWDTRGVTHMPYTFESCRGLLTGVEHWNVIAVEDMGFMFFGAAGFDRDIRRWDTSKVTNMSYMFNKALAFNQPIGKWDTRNVTNMRFMFREAAAFNQPIGKWDTRSVTDMTLVFCGALAFNQDIHSWTMRHDAKTDHMFHQATAMQEENKPEGTRAIDLP